MHRSIGRLFSLSHRERENKCPMRPYAGMKSIFYTATYYGEPNGPGSPLRFLAAYDSWLPECSHREGVGVGNHA
jgi:hypothetical protein